MQKLIGFLAAIVIGLSLSGCSTVSPYSVRVNGYTAPGAPAPIKPGGFFCVVENKEAKNPLLEAEVKGKITKLLETRGYPVTTLDKADYCLLFAYGMGEPAQRRRRRAGLFWQCRLGGGRRIWLGRRLGRLGRPLRCHRHTLGGLRYQRHPLRALAADQSSAGVRLPGPPGCSPRLGGGSPERGRFL